MKIDVLPRLGGLWGLVITAAVGALLYVVTSEAFFALAYPSGNGWKPSPVILIPAVLKGAAIALLIEAILRRTGGAATGGPPRLLTVLAGLSLSLLAAFLVSSAFVCVAAFRASTMPETNALALYGIVAMGVALLHWLLRTRWSGPQ